MYQKPTTSGLQAFKMVCTMLFLFTICTNCKYSIKPSVFKITSQGGDFGSQHEISYDLNYAGSNTSSTLKFPVDVSVQCPFGGNSNPNDLNCNFESGRSTLIPNAGELVINDNDSFSSLHWNVKEHDTFGDDLYTVSIDSVGWKLSPNQCTPYEIRIPVDINYEVKHTSCWMIDLTLSAGAQIGTKAKKDSQLTAGANVGAEFGVGWSSCAQWTEPPNSYVLYANVVMNSPYPTISSTVSTCKSQRIAVKDGYGHKVFPFNLGAPTLPNWITMDDESYIANPSADNIGKYTLTLGVFGPCGAKNLTIYLTVSPEPSYSSQSYTVDACAAAQLKIKDVLGNIALPSSPGASVRWIRYNNQTYTAAPTLTQIGSHNVNLTVAGPCGAKIVNAAILVQPEKPYSNISYSVKACSSVRLTAKNAYGDSVPPSTEPSIQKTWITYDTEDYIAKPLSEDIGNYNLTLSMSNYCGSRNITASISVTSAEDFLVDKKVINVSNTDAVSHHYLSTVPSNKAVVCQNFTSQSGDKYNWFSINEAGMISLTPTNVQAGDYSLKGTCVDLCGHSQESAIDIEITNHADYLFSAGLALAAVVYIMLF